MLPFSESSMKIKLSSPGIFFVTLIALAINGKKFFLPGNKIAIFSKLQNLSHVDQGYFRKHF